MNKIKAVLFDFDGTIADTNEIILKSWRYIYKEYLGRVCRDEEVVGSFGEALADTLKARFPDVDLDEILNKFRNYQHSFFAEEVTLFSGMKELVQELKRRNYLTGIVTSRTKSQTMVGLQKFNMEELFDTFVSCEDTPAHKPDPAPCLIALKRLGVEPKDAIYIGDSRYDIQCAHNAGMQAVLVDWTICLPKEDRNGINRAEYTIMKAEELLDII